LSFLAFSSWLVFTTQLSCFMIHHRPGSGRRKCRSVLKSSFGSFWCMDIGVACFLARKRKAKLCD
jgi:hypothetical protein